MKNKGFTLIELLVVIAVIALLMAILVPVLSRVRQQATALRCRANLRQWGQILSLYVGDNEGHLPQSSTGATWLLRGLAPSEDDPRRPDVHNPVHAEGTSCCPIARKRGRYTTTTHTETREGVHGPWRLKYTSGGPLEAWEIISPPPPFRGSYGFNEWLLRNHLGLPRPTRSTELGPDLLSLRGRSGFPVLLDCVVPYALPREQHIPPPKPSDIGVSQMAKFSIDRHDGHVNGLFLDWSVCQIGLKQLWTLKWHATFRTSGPWTKAGGVLPEDWPEWMRGFKDY